MKAFAVVGFVVVAVVGTATTAYACNECDPDEIERLPHPEPFPANGLLVSDMANADLLISPMVNGAPAALVNAGPWPSGWAWRIEPEPSAGATVDFGDYQNGVCFGDDPSGPIIFAVGPRDVVVPSPPTLGSFDVHVYPTADDADCGPPPDIRYWFHVAVPDDIDPEAEFVRVQVLAGNVVLATHDTWLEPGEHEVGLSAYGDPSWDPIGVCAHVSTLDAAGNRSAVAELCAPCRARVEPADAGPWTSIPGQPAWTDDDLVPDGHCDEPDPSGETGDGTGEDDGSAATTGDPPADTGETSDTSGPAGTGGAGADASDGTVDPGCACTSATRSVGGWWSALALVLLIVTRRNERRRQSRRPVSPCAPHRAPRS